MMGDVINDLPVLSAADVSVTVGSASDLAQNKADSVLLNDDLNTLADALKLARRPRFVTAQTMGFSLGYNLLAFPLSAAGLIVPRGVAWGLQACLLVVLNAMRLSRGIG